MMDPKALVATDARVSHNGNNEDDEEDVSEAGDPEAKNESCSGSGGNLDDWEIRRCGAMAARLLKDVKL
jgi:protein N-lysine methyltransferase METTL21D